MASLDVSALTAINQTALMVARQRSAESKRPDALFHDALAESVAAILPELSLSATFWRAAREMAELSGDAVALRTRYFDEQISGAVRNGVRQIVILGAGLDGRSHRLNVHLDTRFFEIDQSAALTARQTFLDRADLEPKYSVRSIAADFPDAGLAEKLRGSGFDETIPSVFVAEGLTYYLSSADNSRFVSELARIAAPGSVLLADYPADRALGKRGDQEGQTVTATFNAEPRADPWTMFESNGWLLRSRTLTDLASTYGRRLPAQIDELRGGARWWYATAVRS